MAVQSKKEGKDQESIQSSTTPDPGYQWASDNTLLHIFFTFLPLATNYQKVYLYAYPAGTHR